MSIDKITEATKAIARLDYNMYIRSLFDPIQTHAVYNVPVDSVNSVRVALKKVGANRFRICKTGLKSFKIVCFKA